MIEISEPPQQLSTPYGTFVQHSFTENYNGKRHLALTLGTWRDNEAVPVRIHSECLTGGVAVRNHFHHAFLISNMADLRKGDAPSTGPSVR